MFQVDHYFVKFRHYKTEENEGISHVTSCEIIDDRAKILNSGYAICSILDQFSRKIGRKISLGRALLNAFPEDKELRRKFWETYLNLGKN